MNVNSNTRSATGLVLNEQCQFSESPFFSLSHCRDKWLLQIRLVWGIHSGFSEEWVKIIQQEGRGENFWKKKVLWEQRKQRGSTGYVNEWADRNRKKYVKESNLKCTPMPWPTRIQMNFRFLVFLGLPHYPRLTLLWLRDFSRASEPHCRIKPKLPACPSL